MEQEQRSPNQYYEWSLARQQRRIRRLTWAVGAAIVVGLVALVVAAGSDGSGTSTDTEALDAVARQASALESDIAELRSQLARIEDSGKIPAELSDRVEAMEARVEALAEDISGATDCVAAALEALDTNLRRLLERDISAGEYVNDVAPPEC